MKMSGERVIPAPQARVWEALNDPEVLKQSLPGCQEIVKHSPTEFSARVTAKVGPVKANFAGDVTLSDLDPPHSYRISGKGTGGAAGFAAGGADVRLEPVDGQTKLVYEVDAKVGGKLAQIGSRLIDSTARRMADNFFTRFAEVVAGEEAAPEPEAAAEPAKQAPRKKAPARKTPARKAAAKKKAARSGTPEEFATGPETAQSPSLMPEAAIAASAAKKEELRKAAPPRQSEPQQSLPGNNIWWLVGAGIAALLVILVLATV
jgi:carbon monoxide dehydrogenase subunit G